MRKAFLALLLTTALPTGMMAQTQSFEEFRRGIMDDFNSFKNRILDHYADFLEGEWHEYEALEPLQKYANPKPSAMPDISVLSAEEVNDDALPRVESDGSKLTSDEEQLEISIFSTEETAGETVKRSTYSVADASAEGASEGEAPLSWDAMATTFKRPPVQLPPAFPMQASKGAREGMESVPFYGMEILVPQIDFEMMKDLPSPNHYSYQWRKLKQQDVTGQVTERIMPVIKELGLNDYLTYEFLLAWINAKFPDAGITGKVSLLHYLLANAGYNVRIGVNVKDTPLILLESKQELFDLPRISVDGINYYVFSPSGEPMGPNLRTCVIPYAPDMGNKFDFRLNELNLPVREGEYDFEFGKLHLKGKMNMNILPVVYNYPHMDMNGYTESTLQKSLKEDVVRQVHEQLADMDKADAVNELLSFVQNGFDYAIDQQYHGFEKPYFFEENLYYPVSDCEDRAMFYTYLLWNALGLEAHLLNYPDHESASVAYPKEIKGTGYRYGNKRFYISDPTYLHSSTGQCIPAYKRLVPGIDYRFPDSE